MRHFENDLTKLENAVFSGYIGEKNGFGVWKEYSRIERLEQIIQSLCERLNVEVSYKEEQPAMFTLIDKSNKSKK